LARRSDKLLRQKQKPEPDDKEQYDRFREIAGELLSDDADALFEKAVEKVIKPKRRAPKKAPKSK